MGHTGIVPCGRPQKVSKLANEPTLNESLLSEPAMGCPGGLLCCRRKAVLRKKSFLRIADSLTQPGRRTTIEWRLDVPAAERI